MTIIVLASIFMRSMHAQMASDPNFIDADTVYQTPVVDTPHSPHKATFYSAVLPGLGQAYNKKYWKIPILYAGIGTLVYAINFNSRYYNKYSVAYRDFLIQDPGNTGYLEVLPPTLDPEDVLDGGSQADWFENALKNKKDYYRRYRDLSYIGLAVIYVLNLVDASVDAHFKTFDVSDDLSLHIEPYMRPTTTTSGMGMSVRLVF